MGSSDLNITREIWKSNIIHSWQLKQWKWSVRKDEIFTQMVLEFQGVREWVDLTFQTLSYMAFGESDQSLCEDSITELD